MARREGPCPGSGRGDPVGITSSTIFPGQEEAQSQQRQEGEGWGPQRRGLKGSRGEAAQGPGCGGRLLPSLPACAQATSNASRL